LTSLLFGFAGAVMGFCSALIMGPIAIEFGIAVSSKVGEGLIEHFDPVKKARRTFADTVKSVKLSNTSFFTESEPEMPVKSAEVEAQAAPPQKICIIGPEGSGKTNVFSALTGENYKLGMRGNMERGQVPSSTTAVMELPSGKQALLGAQLRDADAVLITIDAEVLKSMNGIGKANIQLKEYAEWAQKNGVEPESIQVVVTKSDLVEKDSISQADMKRLVNGTDIDTQNVFVTSSTNKDFGNLKEALGLEKNEPVAKLQH